MKTKNVLLFILLNSIGLTTMSWADEQQKQMIVAETLSEAEKMALHKRCEEDPDWCEKRKKAKKSDEVTCIENFTCEKTQENPPVEKMPQATETQAVAVEEKWCVDNPEICQRLKTNTKKLNDLQKQIDELHRILSQQNTDQTIEESQKIEPPIIDQ